MLINPLMLIILEFRLVSNQSENNKYNLISLVFVLEFFENKIFLLICFAAVFWSASKFEIKNFHWTKKISNYFCICFRTFCYISGKKAYRLLLYRHSSIVGNVRDFVPHRFQVVLVRSPWRPTAVWYTL